MLRGGPGLSDALMAWSAAATGGAVAHCGMSAPQPPLGARRPSGTGMEELIRSHLAASGTQAVFAARFSHGSLDQTISDLPIEQWRLCLTPPRAAGRALPTAPITGAPRLRVR